MKDDEGYRTVKTLVENTTNTDNISIFRILMTTEDPAPLFDSIENTKVYMLLTCRINSFAKAQSYVN